VSVALFGLPLQASAKFITFQPPGATATGVVKLDNKGEVIGFFNDSSGQHGYIRAADGTFTIINVPGATATVPIARQEDGTIVGNYDSTTGDIPWRGFVRAPDGQFSDIVPPHDRRYTYLSSLSKAGWIAGTGERGGPKRGDSFGFFRDPKGHYTEFGVGLMVTCANSGNTTAGVLYEGFVSHGFVRTPDGTTTQFDPPDAIYTYVSAINDAGTVIGYSDLSSGNGVGFIRASDGTTSTFVVPGDNVQYTFPITINKSGVIAGAYQNGAYQTVDGSSGGGFVRALDGTITIVNVPGSTDTQITSLNDKGQGAGVFVANGVFTGFIWKP